MYTVSFNTNEFNSHKRKSWEDQLRNDFAVAINGKEYICNTDDELEKRFEIISGHDISTDENDYFYLENERYNKQRLVYGMYGFALGYVSFEKVMNTIKTEGKIEIPFSSFYDLRQGNFFKGCFVEIHRA